MTAPLSSLIAAVLAALTTAAFLDPAPAQEPSPEELAAMMAQVTRFTQPGEHHERLGRLLGEWETETSFTMGPNRSPAEPGTATIRWLIEGRWLALEAEGSIMGQPAQAFWLIGYDNFKQSYVTASVSSLDTAMQYAEGDLTRDGSSLIVYGTLDEYLTGEHDKAVKFAWRLTSDDAFTVEVHDLHIGEGDTMVVETRYRRAK